MINTIRKEEKINTRYNNNRQPKPLTDARMPLLPSNETDQAMTIYVCFFFKLTAAIALDIY